MSKKVKIVVDGREYEVDASQNMLQAALGKGLNVPYFCWHPALGSVGACRQCAVIQYKDENDTQGRMVMSCMTPCTDGARFSVEHPDARDMRTAVVEYLMTNHPHDCPVCEEGGHCHLQDMTVMTGHNYRRYRHTKRTHRNQDLGPFINHEMNRCIACYRCVRYYRDYAGGKDLDVFGAHNDVYFGRAEDGTLESPFSGNLVEVCPTGVFTDKPYGEHYTRKWDLQSAPSVCTHCSLGCNISPGERYGTIKRIENRYHGEINGYFLCDRGRFGYGFVNREDRPRQPLLRPDGAAQPTTADAAVAHVGALLKQGRVLGIGSPRASLETNFALRTLVGADHFSTGLAPADAELTALGVELLTRHADRIATIRQAEQADAVLVLGEDVLRTGPRLALALRQATRQASLKAATAAHIPQWQDASVRTLAQDLRSPLFNLTPVGSELDEIAEIRHRAAPLDIARLGMAVAHALDGTAPVVTGLGAEGTALAARIAEALLKAERPLVVSGTGCGSPAVLQAAANIVQALARAERKVSLSLVFAEANSVGVGLLGGHDLEEALRRIEAGRVDTLVVAENDLFRRMPARRLEGALARVRNLVVLDAITHPLTERATVLLPAGSFAESDGTLVNNEGRAQRFFQVFPTDGPLESWRWLQRIATAAGIDGLGEGLDAVTGACAAAVPPLARIVDAAPGAKFRIAGTRVPRQPHRYSGRTAMRAHQSVHEVRPPADSDSPLGFTMEGNTGLMQEPAPLIPMFWYPRWNSPQAVNKFQDEIGGSLKGGDPGVRLFAAGASPRSAWFPVPAAGSGLQAVALTEFFGSEELSSRAPVMQGRIPAAYVALNPATAAKHRLGAGDAAEVKADGASAVLPVRLRADLPDNVVGLPRGLPGVPVLPAGVAVTVGAKT